MIDFQRVAVSFHRRGCRRAERPRAACRLQSFVRAARLHAHTRAAYRLQSFVRAARLHGHITALSSPRSLYTLCTWWWWQETVHRTRSHSLLVRVPPFCCCFLIPFAVRVCCVLCAATRYWEGHTQVNEAMQFTNSVKDGLLQVNYMSYAHFCFWFFVVLKITY